MREGRGWKCLVSCPRAEAGEGAGGRGALCVSDVPRKLKKTLLILSCLGITGLFTHTRATQFQHGRVESFLSS